MKKIIELFNFLAIGAFLSTIILFIGDFFGFSLSLNFQLLWRVLAGFLALTVLLKTGNIKKLLKVSTIPKKFLLLSGLSLFLFALFLLFYPIFRFGSPFVWEDRIANFKAAKRIKINLNEPLKQNFQAKSNNLGTIGLRIISKDVVVEEEKPEEATTSAELGENEETGAVQGVNIEELDEELDGELYFGEPERIVFRIKEEEEKDYFYENTYELNQYWETNYFLFGFPVQKDSEGKNYLFEIVKTKEGETNKIFLIEENLQGSFNFYPRYVYNLASLKTDWDPILLNISRKTNQFLEEKGNQFNLIFTFVLMELLILVFLKKEQERFKEKLNFYLKYGFLIGLFLIIISSLKFEFIQNINYLQNVINNLSVYTFPLTLLTITLGFLLFYLNKNEIEKDLEEEKEEEENVESKRYEEFDKKFSFFAWFNFEYGIGKAWKERRYFSVIGRTITSPLVWLARLPYILGRWVYREGVWYVVGLVAIVILGFMLRVWKLGYSGLYTDETGTLIQVKQILSEGYTGYPRSRIFLYFLSALNFVWLKLGKEISEFSLRIGSALIGTLTMFFSYILSKKIGFNKQVSLLFVFLISLTAILVGFSMAARMYVLFILLSFVLIVLLFLEIKKYSEKGLISYLKNSNIYYLFFLVFLIIFSGDTHQGTFLVLGIIYLYLIYSLIVNRKNISLIKELVYILVFSILGLLFIILTNFLNLRVLLSVPETSNYSYIQLLLNIFPVYIFPLIFLVFLLYCFNKKKNKNFFYLCFVCLIIFLINVFVINTYATIRYISAIFLPLTLITAFSFYVLSKIIIRKKFSIYVLLLLFFLLIPYLFFNMKSIGRIYGEYSGYTFTGTYIDNYRDAIHSLNITDDTALISPVEGALHIYQNKSQKIFEVAEEVWKGGDWDAVKYFGEDNYSQMQIKFICTHSQGFYVADNRRFYKWKTIPEKIRIFVSSNLIKKETSSKDVSVWYWNNSDKSIKEACGIYLN
jgi:hypothetical protein